MSKKGWISIHRSLLEHPFWECEKFTKGQAWIDIILNANHKEKKVLIKGQLIKVGRGQQIRSQVTLAKTWKWDRKTVHRFLKLLESDLMIVQHSTHLTTIITICNYSEFQDLENNSPHLKGQVEGQVSGHAVPKCRGTNNNVNNANNVNNKDMPENLKVSMPPDFSLNDTNTNWISDSRLNDFEKLEIINDFVDYWTLDESKKTDKGWQMAFRRNPIVKRAIVNSKHRGKNSGSHQQTSKPCLSERATENRKRAEREIDEQSMGKNDSSVRS